MSNLFSWFVSSSAPSAEERQKWRDELLEPVFSTPGADLSEASPGLERANSQQDISPGLYSAYSVVSETTSNRTNRESVSSHEKTQETSAAGESKRDDRSAGNTSDVRAATKERGIRILARMRRKSTIRRSTVPSPPDCKSTGQKSKLVRSRSALFSKTQDMSSLASQASSVQLSKLGQVIETNVSSQAEGVSLQYPRCKFKELDSWKKVFEPVGKKRSSAGADGGDILEAWVIRRFFSHAGVKLEKKLLLGILEKVSVMATLIERQMRKANEHSFALFLNSCNAYILTLRFGVAKTKLRVRSRMKTIHLSKANDSSPEASNETTASNNVANEAKIPVEESSSHQGSDWPKIPISLESMKDVILSKEQLSARRILLQKARKKKGKLDYLQEEALDGIYEGLLLLIIESRAKIKEEGQTDELDAETIGTWLVENLQQKLFLALEENKALIVDGLNGLLSLNEFILDTNVYSWLLVGSLKKMIDTRWDDVMEFVKIGVVSAMENVKDRYLVPYLRQMSSYNILNRTYSVDENTGRLILDDSDDASKTQLKEALEEMYLNLENVVCIVSKISLHNLEKLMVS